MGTPVGFRVEGLRMSLGLRAETPNRAPQGPRRENRQFQGLETQRSLEKSGRRITTAFIRAMTWAK